MLSNVASNTIFFFTLWYDLTWNWTLVSRVFGVHFIHMEFLFKNVYPWESIYQIYLPSRFTKKKVNFLHKYWNLFTIYTGCYKKFSIISNVLDISVKLIWFCNLITRLFLVQISSFNSMYRNNSKFYVV